MEYVLEKTSKDYEQMGGKATALSKMGMCIDNIPDWVVVSYKGFDTEFKTIKSDAQNEIIEYLKNKSDDSYFAIRSSAGNEDSAENSFAGQFDTFLYVKKQDVLSKVRDVYMSAFSDRIETYRKENNILDIMVPSVIIQQMVNSEFSGVAFGANPVNSKLNEVVVSSVYGLGSGLVDGIATADTYTICKNEISKEIAKKDFMHSLENGEVVQKDVPEELKDKQILDEKQILEIKDLVLKASEYFGRYQDIEWAIEDGKLYLLQSRPITTLKNSKEGKVNIFDNSNIVESYGGITTPLTFSFIRMVYENVYIELCKIFKVKQEKIEMNSQMFKNMLALIDGRVYYNLYGWYGMLSMFPGLGNNKKFMEQMMGVKESLPDDLFPVPEATFKDKVGLINTGLGLVKGFFKIRKMTGKFYDRLNDALEDKDIDNMDLYELHDYYYELEKKLLHKWDAPLVNDFLAMIFYGNLKVECRKVFKEDGDMIHNDLLCSEGGIISSEPAKRIKEMAKIVQNNEDAIKLLENEDVLYIKKELPKYEELNKKINEYLDKFSDRCLEELKLETLTLKDNPRNLYTSIATFAKRIKGKNIEEVDDKQKRLNAEKKVRQKLRFKPVQKAKFDFILKQARYTVKNRENLRFERTRLFGRIRELFLRIGFILTSMNVIEEKRDIFYLEVDEILYYIDGKSTTNNLKELIAIRKEQFEKYADKLPDERFFSYGAVNIGNDFKREVKSDSSKEMQADLKGIGASPGIVKGKVRIIRNPANAKLEQGEILVAEFTDPGWIMLFPAASGILVERGSLLSHSAIVSRELGIPAVVGITGLLDSLVDGDLVELNGTTGEVRKLEETFDKTITNVNDLLEYAKINFGKKVLYPENEITYLDFYNKVKALANKLSEVKSEKVGVVSENRYEWEVLFFAVLSSGKIFVPIDKNLPKEEIKTIIDRAKIDTIFVSDKYKEKVDVTNIYNFDDKELFEVVKINNENVYNSVNSDETALIYFTSGTTGKSKAVELSQKNIIFNMLNSSEVFDLNKEDICLSVLPQNHVLEGLFVFLQSLYKGTQRVFCNDLDEIIENIKKYNITFIGAVPAIYEYLYDRKDELKECQSLRFLFSGGAKLNLELVSKYKEIGINLLQGYGLTECGPVVSFETLENTKLGSCGKLIPHVDIRIVNKNEDKIGEILIKGDNVFKGYYEDQELTNNCIEDGWFNTGDLGYLDKEVYLFVVGRANATIVLPNGEKIFPEEIEEKINGIEGVKESLVYYDNKRIVAKIVSEEEIEGLKEKLNDGLPQYKKIDDIIFTKEALIKNDSGKILREANCMGDDPAPGTMIKNSESNFEKIKNIITSISGNSNIELTSNFITDIGLDSLEIVELYLKVEKEFGIKIPREKRKEILSVEDLINKLK